MAMYRADLPNRRRVPMVIDRGELQTRIAKGQLLRAVRLVPLLRGGGTSTIPYPEYRLFGIKEGSVYSLLGLRNTDVLVAADGFIIRDPGVFPAFVELLGTQPTGSIEIMRHDEPILFEYTIE
jgi:type II secretory pathway component PulC